jgi:PAS domain S-box-containing protein
MEELSGVQAEEMLGRGDYEYVLPLYGERRPILIDLAILPAEELEGKYEDFERRGRKLIGEEYIRNVRGEKLYVHVTASPLHNSKGEVIGSIESIRDFTERKQMEDRAAYLASFSQLNPNPVLEVDSSGKVTFFNPAAQRILETLGIGRENFTIFLPADLHEILRDPNKKKELTFYREIRVMERVFAEDIYLAPQFFEGARVFVRDITVQKRSEEEVCFKNIILTTQQECAIEGILVVDDNAVIISYNRRFVEMWGIPPEMPTIGDDAPLLQFVANKPMDPEGFLARVSYLYEHREEKSREEIALKDGRVFDRYSAPMTGSDGKYYGRVWYFSDITERKQMEEKLRKASAVAEEYAQRLEYVLEGSNDATWEWDLITNLGFLNKRYYEMIEYTPEEGESDLTYLLKTIHPEDVAAVQRRMQDTREGKTGAYEAYFRMIAKSGKLRHVMARGKIVRFDEDGRPTRMAGVVTDVTEQTRLRIEVNMIHNLESIGLLAGGLAHDFNNMLSIIYGNITFAKTLAGDDTAIAESLTDAEEACERAKELGIRLQFFSKESSPVKEPIELLAIIEVAAGVLFQGSRISYPISAPDDLLPVDADPRQIRQVFENLLTNAQEAISAVGTVKIDIKNCVDDDKEGLLLGPGRYVCIAIQDDGKGIPEDHLPKIYNPYFSTKDAYSQKGLGLGLSTCQAILKKHGGHIFVESTLGVGTRVTVYLPATMEEAKLTPEG